MIEAPAGSEVPFVEPEEHEVAGNYRAHLELLPYETFMIREGIPVSRGYGVYDVRDLDLAPWPRLGGRGAFIALEGASEKLGLYVLELGPGEASLPERHLYEEYFYVVEGYGTTETWDPSDGAATKSTFEWGPHSLFSIPRNGSHRLLNASSSRALFIGATNAPRICNAIGDLDWIFASDFGAELGELAPDIEAFKPRLDFLTAPHGRAMWKTRVVPDLAGIPLPRDGQRAPGHRRVELSASGRMYTFINNYPVGRYSRAHYHPSGAVLICVTGKGYTFNWTRDSGPTPWRDKKADSVERVDYVPGGLVAAAPGGGEWFHQHFGTGREPLRQLVISALHQEELTEAGRPDAKPTSINLPLEEGGHTIPYSGEDPYIREEFNRSLEADGLKSDMPSDVYS
jgi:mannose-6-phosphate isomerase-like protein (cupin superfamily)